MALPNREEANYRRWLNTPFSRPRPTSHAKLAAENEQLREQVRELRAIVDDAMRALCELAYGFGGVTFAQERYDAIKARLSHYLLP